MSIQITTELVKELRDATGISVMQCRRALEEAMGDMTKALAILKKNSSNIALKKADRTASDGAVIVKSGSGKAVLITLHCETDFVSRNEDFTNLLSTLADKALAEGIEAMKSGAKELIDGVIQKTGEKIELGECYEIVGPVLGNYVHNGKMAAVVSLEGGTESIARDIAMHITAMKPEYITMNDVNDQARAMMNEVFAKEVASSDKPEDIKKKMLEGKINTYFKERTLTEQPFIKDPDQTVGALVSKAGAKIAMVKRVFI